ncbi:hypothetical protein ACXR2U_16370 [Jatrophihabitans sp. YIM 134969]
MADEDLTDAQQRRRAASTCAWCGGAIDVKETGRLPKWCSPSCRQRAWEQTRAATSGRSAVEVVERRVKVACRPQAPAAPPPPARRDWPAELRRLAHDLHSGGVYQRDLATVATAVNEVVAAIRRRESHLMQG